MLELSLTPLQHTEKIKGLLKSHWTGPLWVSRGRCMKRWMFKTVRSPEISSVQMDGCVLCLYKA